jgi:hypothetical protein
VGDQPNERRRLQIALSDLNEIHLRIDGVTDL